MKSPGLQEIQDRFMVNYVNGGLAAVEKMVEDLAAEVEGAAALHDAGTQIGDEAILAQRGLSDEELGDAIGIGRDTTRDSISAMTRHSFATFLLGVIQEQ